MNVRVSITTFTVTTVNKNGIYYISADELILGTSAHRHSLFNGKNIHRDLPATTKQEAARRELKRIEGNRSQHFDKTHEYYRFYDEEDREAYPFVLAAITKRYRSERTKARNKKNKKKP